MAIYTLVQRYARKIPKHYNIAAMRYSFEHSVVEKKTNITDVDMQYQLRV